MDICRYVLLESKCEQRTLYGIAAVDIDNGCITVLQSYADLCSKYSDTASFVELCNTQKLSLCHLPEAIDDFLAGF